MLSNSDMKKLANKELFDRICALAKKRELAKLQTLADEYTLDVRHAFVTPIQSLAEKGDHSAVNVLLDCGCSPGEALLGYAKGGHHDQVNNMLYKQGMPHTFAMAGYGLADNQEKLEELSNIAEYSGLTQDVIGMLCAIHGNVSCLNDELQYSILQSYNAAALARKGRTTVVGLLIAMNPRLVTKAAMFYAIGGHHEAVNMLLANQTSISDRDEIIACTTIGYAAIGNHEKVDEWKAKLLSTELISFDHFLRLIMKSYGTGGHIVCIRNIIQSGSFVSLIPDEDRREKHANQMILAAMKGLASAGYEKHVNAMLDQHGFDEEVIYDILKTYVKFGWLGCADRFLNQMKSHRIEYIFGDHKIHAFSNYKETDQFRLVSLLTHIDHIDFKVALIGGLTSKEINCGLLIAKSTKLNQIMNQYDVEYDLALRLIEMPLGIRCWLLQGEAAELFGLNDRPLDLPYDIFIAITSHILGLSPSKAVKLHAAVRQRFFQPSANQLENQREAEEMTHAASYQQQQFGT